MVTDETSQLLRGWLKAWAVKNMSQAPENMVEGGGMLFRVTEETSQALRGWLKEWRRTCRTCPVTDETSQLLRGWLKEEASENM